MIDPLVITVNEIAELIPEVTSEQANAILLQFDAWRDRNGNETGMLEHIAGESREVMIILRQIYDAEETVLREHGLLIE